MNTSPEPAVQFSVCFGGDELLCVRHGGVWHFCSTVDGVSLCWSGALIPNYEVDSFIKAGLCRAAERAAVARARSEGGAR